MKPLLRCGCTAYKNKKFPKDRKPDFFIPHFCFLFPYSSFVFDAAAFPKPSFRRQVGLVFSYVP
jgi:hypothetical protein